MVALANVVRSSSVGWCSAKSADNRRRVGHKKCSQPLYLSRGGVSTYHAVIGRRFTKSVHWLKNIGVFDSSRVRFRILGSSSGTSPASPASSASAHAKDADDASHAGDAARAVKEHLEMKGERGERISTGKGEKDLREEREKIWGKNALGGKGGKRSLGGKRKSFSGGTGPRGQWGDRISNGKGEKDFGKRILGGKGFRGETGGKDLIKKGGKSS